MRDEDLPFLHRMTLFSLRTGEEDTLIFQAVLLLYSRREDEAWIVVSRTYTGQETSAAG